MMDLSCTAQSTHATYDKNCHWEKLAQTDVFNLVIEMTEMPTLFTVKQK